MTTFIHRAGLILIIGAMGGCASSEQTIVTEPSAVITETATVEVEVEDDSGGDDTTTTAPVEDETAEIGDSIVLAGQEGGGLSVRLVAVRDPAPADEFFGPEKGNRLVGIRLRLTNVGEAVYDDSPSNGAAVIDRQDQQFNGSLFDSVKPALGTLKIRPSDSRSGWLTFEVPRRAKLRTFQFTLDSGFGPETGEWTLR